MTGPTPQPARPGTDPAAANGATANGATAAGARGPAAGSPRRDRMLSELAAELRAARDEHHRDVAQLRGDLGGLSGLVGDNADLLGQVMPRVRDLEGRLADLAEQLATLAGAVAAGGGGRTEQDDDRPPTDWPSLSADAAAAEWQALGDWVAYILGPFYELTRAQLPDCWPLHRPAVLELVWLRRVYVAAHRADATPGAAADWHTRWRREALANIAAAIPVAWCRPGEHWVERFSRRPGPPPDRTVIPTPPREHVPGQRPGPDHYELVPGEEPTNPAYWAPHFQAARHVDLTWRRQRDAATGAPSGT